MKVVKLGLDLKITITHARNTHGFFQHLFLLMAFVMLGPVAKEK